MKKWFLFLMITCALNGWSQTETFDIIHYTPPKGWIKDSRPGVVTYTHVNTVTGGFCMLAIYASHASTGNEQNDFTAEWKTLVMTPFKAAPGPKTETQTNPEGWKAVAGAASVKQNGGDAYVILTVFSGFGKTVPVLVNLNDQAYLPQVDSILGNINPDKTAAPVAIAKSGTGERFGHMICPLLKGWKIARYPAAMLYTPSDISPDQYLELRVMASKPFSGNLKQAMAESWNDALQQLKSTSASGGDPYTIITEKTSFKGWEYIRARGSIRSAERATDVYDTHLFVIKLNDRIERILVTGLMNVNNGDFSPWVNPVYQQAIENFFYSVRFDDWKEPDLANGKITSDGMNGLYEGLKLSGGALDGQYTLFFPNGQVFNGPKFPLDGFYGMNTRAEAELRARYWGTYTLQNGKGMIKMGYGNIPFRVSGKNLVLTTQNTEHTYVKLSSVDGAVLNGTYTFTGDWGRTPPSVTFTSDGKFTDNGALDILHHATMDPYNITKEPGSGKYQVKDFTLVLDYADGRHLQLVFTGEGFNKTDPAPKSLMLSFNRDVMYRK